MSDNKIKYVLSCNEISQLLNDLSSVRSQIFHRMLFDNFFLCNISHSLDFKIVCSFNEAYQGIKLLVNVLCSILNNDKIVTKICFLIILLTYPLLYFENDYIYYWTETTVLKAMSFNYFFVFLLAMNTTLSAFNTIRLNFLYVSSI